MRVLSGAWALPSGKVNLATKENGRPALLYSTNTWLAWAIAETYYHGIHYCWCAPYYDGRVSPRRIALPPSASPAEIYNTLRQDVVRADRHSASILRNRVGILRGAMTKRVAGVITRRQEQEIITVVNEASAQEFRPVLYVIPFLPISRRVLSVPTKQRSHPLAPEYIIRALPSHLFDMIELEVQP